MKSFVAVTALFCNVSMDSFTVSIWFVVKLVRLKHEQWDGANDCTRGEG